MNHTGLAKTDKCNTVGLSANASAMFLMFTKYGPDETCSDLTTKPSRILGSLKRLFLALGVVANDSSLLQLDSDLSSYEIHSAVSGEDLSNVISTRGRE